MNTIIMGEGDVVVCTVRAEDGRVGLMFHKSHKRPIGCKVDPAEIEPSEEDTCVWFNNLESARVVQDRVNTLLLQMTGYVVANDPDVEYQ